MDASRFLDIIGAEYYTGVPDSLLRPLCDCIMDRYGMDSKHHIIAANEGNAVAIAAGYHLATGRVPVVYMQNSGEGNIINPLASLLNEKVYGIPEVFVIGWRGEPGVHDEPQHIFQGEVTLELLDVMRVPHYIVDGSTSEDDIKKVMEDFSKLLEKGSQVAFVIRKGALHYDNKIVYKNNNSLSREQCILKIVEHAGKDLIVCTTGKASRELYEIREQLGMSHDNDLLMVGSMGHASSIAFGIALQKPDKRIWCIDGDGAALMHMGAMAVIGKELPKNLIHIVINNGAHESVGGMPTAEIHQGYSKVANAVGYSVTYMINNEDELQKCLKNICRKKELTLVEVKAQIGSRLNLGRPSESLKQAKNNFMNAIKSQGLQGE